MLDSSGFEKLLLDMRTRASELITEEGAEILSEYQSAQKALSETKREIARCERKLEELLAEIDKMEKAEVGDIPEEYIKKFVTKYTKGFAPGDVVYALRERTERKKCSVCEGEGKFEAKKLGTKEVILAGCPECRGRGTVIKSFCEVKKEKIKEVGLKLLFEKDRVSVWNYDTVRLYGDEYPLGVTGLYGNLEEAEEAEAEAKKLMEDNNA